MQKLIGGGLRDRLRTWFPDREFFMRSEGQVRFIKVSGRIQMTAAGIVAALLLVWIASMASMALASYLANQDRLSLLNREARVASSESRLKAYGDDVGKVAEDLQRRQDFIDKVTQAHIGELPKETQQGETVSNSTSEATETIKRVSIALPQAAALARIEARQLAFIEGMTRAADRRSAAAEARLVRLGLNPRAMLARLDDKTAQGGPFSTLSTAADGSIDPRFERFGLSLARMEALERSLAALPQALPANLDYISSGFGYRADPFTGGADFHPGLDFKGPTGAPIYAAARGTASFVGYRSGYGNVVEVTHGNGLVTRYAHMSGFRTTVGKLVKPGELIGLIGSTGRSTGPHLHFEVRIHDRPVNPRPFLEVVPDVFQKSGPSAAQHSR